MSIRATAIEPVKTPERVLSRNRIAQNYITYGARNDYPTTMRRLVDASPTASACRDKFIDFLSGYGFEDEKLNSIIINRRGDTVFSLLEQVSADLANYNSFHLHIVYNLNYRIDSIVRINPEYVRKSSPDSYGFSPKVVINDNWTKDNSHKAESGYSEKYFVDVFNPSEEAVKQQIEKAGGDIRNWGGQVFSYWSNAPIYPKTIYDACRIDIESDALLSDKTRTDLLEGYMAHTVFAFKESLEEEELRGFKQMLNRAQGADGDRLLMLDGVEDGLDIKTLESRGSDTQFENTESKVRKTIMRQFGQLAILHGEDRANAISADGKAIENAYNLYNKLTHKKRKVISQVFSKLFALVEKPIESGFEILQLSFLDKEDLKSNEKEAVDSDSETEDTNE